MPFLTPLQTEWVEYRGGLARHRLIAPLRYVVETPGVPGAGVVLAVEVPAGYVTDFASVPRLFRWVCPLDRDYTQAAVVHDYLSDLEDFDQVLSDAIFRAAMKELGVSFWRRVLMFYAVRIYQALKGRC